MIPGYIKKLGPLILLFSLLLTGCSIQTTDNASKVNTQVESNVLPDQPLTESRMAVHYIDVGQGDAILVQSGSQNMLIDAGDNEHGQTVVDYLRAAGVKQLDVLVGTHPHADHIGGMDTVIEDFPVQEVYMPKVTSTTKSFRDVLTALETKNLKVTDARAGTSLPLTAVKASILAPVKNQYEDLNNYSAVVRVACGNKVFLFTGDAQRESEEDMLAAGCDLKADVLKVGHHGSSSGTSSSFLAAVKPEYAVILLGEDNPYGHPHRETLTRLQAAGNKILRTDSNGNIIIKTDGNNLQITTDR